MTRMRRTPNFCVSCEDGEIEYPASVLVRGPDGESVPLCGDHFHLYCCPKCRVYRKESECSDCEIAW